MNTKRNTLVGSLIALALSFVFANPVFFNFCVNTYTFGGDIGCLDKFPDSAAMLLMGLSIPILILSLITYKMRDEVFRAWWGFARWWVPVIVVVTVLLENAGGGGGWGLGSGGFDVFVLSILYMVLTIVSLTKIFNAHSRTK